MTNDISVRIQIEQGWSKVVNGGRKMGLGTIAIIKLILFIGMCIFGVATIFFLAMVLRIDILWTSEEAKIIHSLRYNETANKTST